MRQFVLQLLMTGSFAWKLNLEVLGFGDDVWAGCQGAPLPQTANGEVVFPLSPNVIVSCTEGLLLCLCAMGMSPASCPCPPLCMSAGMGPSDCLFQAARAAQQYAPAGAPQAVAAAAVWATAPPADCSEVAATGDLLAVPPS